MDNYHIPVLKDKCIEGLNIKPDGIYVDVTFGGGGHSREILKHLGENGKLIVFDQDSDTFKNIPEDNRLIFANSNFKFLKKFLRFYKIDKIDGLLADLGVSSHHFDTPERGFSFRFDGELDMRMNQQQDLTAAEILNTYTRDELLYIFRFYGEIKNAYKLANVICSAREEGKFDTIENFVIQTASCIPKFNDHKYLAKVFQALRIETNKELEALKDMLLQSKDALSTGGRLVVISYHSLEDRLVKLFIKTGNFEGIVEKDLYGNISSTNFKAVNRKLIIASESEIEANNRSRSAKLRIAEKI